MKLDIIYQHENLAVLCEKVNDFFKTEMKLIKEQLSIFEAWSVRPFKRVYIPKIYAYRILRKNGIYYFGTI